MDDLKNYIEEITNKKTVYSFGDKWLYRMSREVLSEPDSFKIASMVWLIGRSYAASPERITRAIDYDEYNKNKNEMPEIVFNNISNYIINNLSYDDYVYSYNNDYYDDIKQLCKTIDFVYKLNKSKNSINRATNMISFSSKFLHFCMPNSVFIFDQYSQKGCSILFGKNKNVQLFNQNNSNELDKLSNKYNNVKEDVIKNDYVNNMFKEIEDSDKNSNREKQALKEYVNHVCGCYSLASLINDYGIKGIQIDEGLYSIPRLVDGVLMSIGRI